MHTVSWGIIHRRPQACRRIAVEVRTPASGSWEFHRLRRS